MSVILVAYSFSLAVAPSPAAAAACIARLPPMRPWAPHISMLLIVTKGTGRRHVKFLQQQICLVAPVSRRLKLAHALQPSSKMHNGDWKGLLRALPLFVAPGVFFVVEIIRGSPAGLSRPRMCSIFHECKCRNVTASLRYNSLAAYRGRPSPLRSWI